MKSRRTIGGKFEFIVRCNTFAM